MPRAVNQASLSIGANMEQDSGSSSECEDEVERAARNRIAHSTQDDYNSELRMIKVFAVENGSTFSACIAEGQLVEPVPFALGQAYLVHIRDAMGPWPLDPRPAETRTGLKHYSTSKINGAISAIKYSYSKVSCPVNNNTEQHTLHKQQHHRQERRRVIPSSPHRPPFSPHQTLAACSSHMCLFE